jgi:hypothetical protein
MQTLKYLEKPSPRIEEEKKKKKKKTGTTKQSSSLKQIPSIQIM